MKDDLVSIDIPLLHHKYFDHPTVFTPDSLLREAKRQKSLPVGKAPSICILDPDGDIVSNLLAKKRAKLNPHWPCYHTELYNFVNEEMEFGIIGGAVGASFAVLVAEELFASGCRLVISLTSSGQILPIEKPPYFILIEMALRDEGTSYHYLPPNKYSRINNELLELLNSAFKRTSLVIRRGATWTTDAPFRETAKAIEYCRSEGILSVEMEAAALYAFAEAKGKHVICIAHVTNMMGNLENDFEKGDAEGSMEALKLITLIAKSWKKLHVE